MKPIEANRLTSLGKSQNLLVQNSNMLLAGNSPEGSTPMTSTAKFTRRNIDSGTPQVIFEEQEDSQINFSEQEEIEKDVIDFMKATKAKQQQDYLMGKSSMHYEITIPKKTADSGQKQRTVKRDDPFTFDKPVFNPESKLKMKGIIGGVGNQQKKQNKVSKQKRLIGLQSKGSRRKLNSITPIDFEKDLDIDEVIPREYQIQNQNFFKSEVSGEPEEHHHNSFQTLNEFNANEEVDIDPNIKVPKFQALEP